jgi:WXG100 family type VII secretion target
MPNVNVTYEEMRTAARRLRDGQTEIESKLNELKNLVDSLVNGGYVTDSSSKQFQEQYMHFTNGATNTINGLNGMGHYLDQAANTFEQADKELSTRLQRS